MTDPRPSNAGVFFSCDWGTSSFRLRLASQTDGQVLAETKSAMGAKALTETLSATGHETVRARAFHDYLAGQVHSLLKPRALNPQAIPIVVSGMASSSVGWRELPYARVPFSLNGSGCVTASLELTLTSSVRLPVWLVSGVATNQDMMRGEETELIGIFDAPDTCDLASGCRVILPGTHSKHMTVSDGQMIDFHTCLSGELFDVLTRHSILRFTTQGDDADLDKESFTDGVEASRRAGLMPSFFQARSRAILQNRSAPSNRDFLSGLIIGAELEDLRQRANDGPVVLAAPGPMLHRYLLAVEALGLGKSWHSVNTDESQPIVVRGHRRILLRQLEMV